MVDSYPMLVFFRLVIKHRLAIGITSVLYVIDQMSKALVSGNMDAGSSIPSEGFVRLTFIYNTGSAFGLLSGMNTPLMVVSFLAIAVIVFIYRTFGQNGNMWKVSLGCQLAGALGNLTDRLILGKVVDFIDVGPWPVFNVADSCLGVGTVLLGWLILRSNSGGNSERASVPDPFGGGQT